LIDLAETYGHGKLSHPDWEVKSIPVFLDLCLECFEGGTVDVDCYVIWSGVGREDNHEALVDKLRLDEYEMGSSLSTS
jgi:hypothetical protein